MQVKCSLCGGETAVSPGQEMLRCSFCGSALVLDEPSGPEHLILPHARCDRDAREALTSFLIAKRIPHPKGVAVEFSFVPYLLVEAERGGQSVVAGTAAPPPEAKILPYPPAGAYRYFDESLAGGEKVLALDAAPGADSTGAERPGVHRRGTEATEVHRVLHLPIYRVRFRASGRTWSAAVVGESWQVLADELPDERPAALDRRNVLVAACLFAAYLLIGALGHGWLARAVLLTTAATGGFIIFALRKRLSAGR